MGGLLSLLVGLEGFTKPFWAKNSGPENFEIKGFGAGDFLGKNFCEVRSRGGNGGL